MPRQVGAYKVRLVYKSNTDAGQSWVSLRTRPLVSYLKLSALGYSPLALFPFPSSLPGLGALGVRPRRLSPGSGTGSCSGEGGRLRWGGLLGGAGPSSGEAADGDGAAAAAECPGPGSGPIAAASVTPLPPHWAARARVGDPQRPAPLFPNTIPSPSPPPSLRARVAASGE